MSGNSRLNPNVEDFVRKNTVSIVKHVEENPNTVNQYRRMYKCKDCDKEYHNFQALGGHRASHRSNLKTKNLENPTETKLHECRICGEKFAIGQALGGHMRKHWLTKVDKEENWKVLCHENNGLVNKRNWKTAMVRYQPDESCSSSSVTSNSTTTSRKVLGYDLNLTPHENELKNGVRSDSHSFSEAS